MKVIPRPRKRGEPTHQLFVLVATNRIIDSPIGKVRQNVWVEIDDVYLDDPAVLEIKLDPIVYWDKNKVQNKKR